MSPTDFFIFVIPNRIRIPSHSTFAHFDVLNRNGKIKKKVLIQEFPSSFYSCPYTLIEIEKKNIIYCKYAPLFKMLR